MSTTDTVSTVASAATAVGVVGVFWQLRVTRRQMVAAFERTFVDRYERIMHDIPLPLLLGEDLEPDPKSEDLRPFFDYFELCEQELYYRRFRKVSTSTWPAWWEGIRLNMRRPAFRAGWDQLRNRVSVPPGPRQQVRHTQFELFRDAMTAICAGEPFDPRRRWWQDATDRWMPTA